MSTFGQLTERMASFRKELIRTQPSVCIERAASVTRAYMMHEDKQTVVKRAYSLDMALRSMNIFIEPNTLLVGNQASANRAAPIFPEYGMKWLINELDSIDKRESDPFVISEYNKRKLRELYPYWNGRTVSDKSRACFPTASRRIFELGIIAPEDGVSSGDSHIAFDYGPLLRRGLSSLRRRAELALQRLDLTEPESLKKSCFYQAAMIAIDAVGEFAGRYAELAERQARECADDDRKRELTEIARICRKVPMQPAETFHEALQSVWFVHLALQIESNGQVISLGRMDQYLLPYYENSLSLGMTEEQACELLTNLWLKAFSLNEILPLESSRAVKDSVLCQNVTIGGLTPEGEDAVNALSHLILKSVAQARVPQPGLSVRCRGEMSDGLIDECVAALHEGACAPALYNDDAIIPALERWGVAPEDAQDYCAVDCASVAVPGKWGYGSSGTSGINFPRTLMIALNDGVDVDSGESVCTGCGHFMQMRSFDDVLRAWDVTIRELTRHAVIFDSCVDMVRGQETPNALVSALTDDCLARGRTLGQGGAVYDFVSQVQVGIANLADSLAAIKKCVYDDCSISRKQLWDALTNNFTGETGERVRKVVQGAPKYGNNDDYVDGLLLQAYQSYTDEIAQYGINRDGAQSGSYYSGTASDSAYVSQGLGTGATPDGRSGGKAFAIGCTPTAETERSGAEAALASVAKLPIESITGGIYLCQPLETASVELVRKFFGNMHGSHIQFTSAE